MPRRNRGDTSDGSRYHVTSEINRRTLELYQKEMKRLFITVIAEAKDKYAFTLWNFCIMDNHFHFLIQPAVGVSLSDIIKWIKMVYAIRWNNIHRIHGHLWGDRFWCRRIRDDADFLTVYKYIDENPLQAGLVTEAWLWEFGGLFHHQQGITLIVADAPGWVVAALPQHGTVPIPSPSH
ncbi:hypothetical protein FACS1894172_15000 [Spirochaetia bacterium]|nr:hypothetical protein FACS1894164_14590 [Spirochaetia bacterium]GHU34558.1 hypothetical protein FACS1894172_15000 [Spirochaetia bacterium]